MHFVDQTNAKEGDIVLFSNPLYESHRVKIKSIPENKSRQWLVEMPDGKERATSTAFLWVFEEDELEDIKKMESMCEKTRKALKEAQTKQKAAQEILDEADHDVAEAEARYYVAKKDAREILKRKRSDDRT